MQSKLRSARVLAFRNVAVRMGTVVAPWLRDINLVEKPLSVGELAVSYASRGAEVDHDLWRRDPILWLYDRAGTETSLRGVDLAGT